MAGVNVAWTVPVPLSDTVWGLPEALSVMETLPVSAPSACGVNVTLMAQLLLTASVPPQVVEETAKSPLGVMLLMFSVPVPVFLSVTVLAALVSPSTTLPKDSDVGVKVTVGLPLLAFTVRLSVVVSVNPPDTPWIVTVDVPVVAVALAAKLSELVVVAGFGLKVAVTPAGRFEAERVTLPVNPLAGVIVMVLVPLLPCVTVTVVGLADNVKLGLLDGHLFTRLAALTEPIPVAKSQPVCVPYALS